MKRTLPILFSLILATMVFLALPLSASAATGDAQGVDMQATTGSSLAAGTLTSQDNAAPQGSIIVRDEFSMWGLNDDPMEVHIYDYEESGTAVKSHKGISFDRDSNTIILKNVPATNNALCLYISGMGNVNVKLVGSSKICIIQAEETNLSFIGDGELFLNPPFTYTDQYGWHYEDQYIFSHSIQGIDCKLKIAKTATMHFDSESADLASIILDFNKNVSLADAFTCEAKPSKQLKWATETIDDVYEHVLTVNKFSLTPAVTPVSELSISGIVDKVYTGKDITQKVVVKDGSVTLKRGTDYSVSYKNNKNVGTASVTITGKGSYEGSVPKKFKITKAANSMNVKVKTKTVKASALKKAKQTVSGAIIVTKSQGAVTYAKVAKGSAKQLTISKKGVITVAKNTGKNSYKIKVKVTAKGDSNHKKKTEQVTVTIKVK